MTEPFDGGAQAERTTLSWQRTGIGALAIGALLCRWHIAAGRSPWLPVLLVAVAGLAVLTLVPARYRTIMRDVRSGRSPLPRVAVPAAALSAAAVVIGVAIEVFLLA